MKIFEILKITRLALVSGAMLLLPGMASATTSYYVETSQSGGEQNIDSGPGDVFLYTFTPSAAWDFGGGIITIKEGSQMSSETPPTNQITLTLNTSGLTDNLASVTLNYTDISQSYSAVNFFLAAAYTVTPGVSYDVVLSSPTVKANNTEYFIKTTITGIFDSQGNPAPTGGSAVPEPSTCALMLAGAGTMLWGRRRYGRR